MAYNNLALLIPETVQRPHLADALPGLWCSLIPLRLPATQIEGHSDQRATSIHSVTAVVNFQRSKFTSPARKPRPFVAIDVMSPLTR